MKRWETLAALLAVVLASLSVVELGGHKRPALALAAVAVLALLGLARLRAAAASRRGCRALPHAYERAMRIQEKRDQKFGP